MSNFQSMPRDYRISDESASGFPIEPVGNVRRMRKVDRSEFGARLHSARLAAGVSQGELAEAAGTTQSNIAELEKTGQGSAAVTKMARKIGVDAHWLATGEGERGSSALGILNNAKMSPEARACAGMIDKLPADQRIELQDIIRSEVLARIPPRYGDEATKPPPGPPTGRRGSPGQ